MATLNALFNATSKTTFKANIRSLNTFWADNAPRLVIASVTCNLAPRDGIEELARFGTFRLPGYARPSWRAKLGPDKHGRVRLEIQAANQSAGIMTWSSTA